MLAALRRADDFVLSPEAPDPMSKATTIVRAEVDAGCKAGVTGTAHLLGKEYRLRVW